MSKAASNGHDNIADQLNQLNIKVSIKKRVSDTYVDRVSVFVSM